MIAPRAPRGFPPVADWVRGYRSAWLRADLIAGLTLAAYTVPVALAYASLAGLPPEAGLYGYMLGGIAYTLFGRTYRAAAHSGVVLFGEIEREHSRD